MGRGYPKGNEGGVFDKDGNWVNPSATKPTPTAAQVKAQFADAVTNKKTASYKNYTPPEELRLQTALDFYGVDDSYFSRMRYKGGADYAKKYGLTELEHKAVYSYTENKVFGRLNALNGKWATHKITAAETKAAETFTEILNGALKKLPEHSGVVRRDLSLTKKQLERYAVGADVTEVHFSSTTLKMEGIAHFRDDGNTVFFFDLKKGSGADISTMSEYGGTESEILIQSGRSFKIESKVFDNSEDRWVVKLKEV